jgi:hypothetical protein
MNMPGFTAEVAIHHRPAFFQMAAVRANRAPDGGVTMASNCPKGCYCHCGGFLIGAGEAFGDSGSQNLIVPPWPPQQDQP